MKIIITESQYRKLTNKISRLNEQGEIGKLINIFYPTSSKETDSEESEYESDKNITDTELIGISSDKLTSPLKKTKFPKGNYGVYRKGIDKPGTVHPGIDLTAVSGTELFAPGDGKVTAAIIGQDSCGGKIRIEHTNGLTSSFCHLSGVFVKPGDIVKRGEKIGLTGGQPGTAGAGYSTAPHLHWEIRKSGQLVDPIEFSVQKFYDKDSDSLTMV